VTRGYKVQGQHQVDLTWSRTGTDNVDILRDDKIVATVPDNGHYTDATGGRGKASYEYKVCEVGLQTNKNCSNPSRVDF
jgi:hypothetical protein